MMTIRVKDRDAVIQALRAGVVPRTCQHLIQVGRVREVEAMIRDLDRIAEGGSGFRLVIGEYGAGKTFFLNLVRSIALEKKLVTMHADLNPGRRLYASGGQARSLYSELAKNMATRTRPDGNALPGVVERFVNEAMTSAQATGKKPEVAIQERLTSLTDMVGGYDFANVIAAYCRGFLEGNEVLKSDAIRWLRGEFSTKTDARTALDVRSIIDDDAIYDHLKLLARFIRLSGFTGLLICLDEMVNLYKLSNAPARNGNYEQILRILNDSLQGSAEGLGFILGGTPEFLFDSRRGLYSYAALQSRLAENTFARGGLQDFTGPVLRLSSLTPEDFYVLLQKLRDLQACGDPKQYLLPDEALSAYMQHAAKRLGESYFRTPRTTIKAFLDLLAVLEQNPGVDWHPLVGTVDIPQDMGGDNDKAPVDDELASFRL